jgi:hypothetical protein
VLNSELEPSISAAATTATWSGVTGTGRPEDNADVTATAQRTIVPQFPSIEIKQGEAGHTGTRTVTHTARRGTSTISGGTWSLPSSAVSGATVTINATTGTVSLSGVAISGSYTVRYTHTDGIATDLAVNVTYVPTPPTANTGRIARSTTASGVSSTAWTTVLEATINDGPVGWADVALTYNPDVTGTSTEFEARLQRAGVDVATIGSVQAIDGSGLLDPEFVAAISGFSGYYSAAAGTATWRLQIRRVIGTGTFPSATGSITINQQPT